MKTDFKPEENKECQASVLPNTDAEMLICLNSGLVKKCSLNILSFSGPLKQFISIPMAFAL